jgi:hypothetical protein
MQCDGALDFAGIAHADRLNSIRNDGATAWTAPNWPIPEATRVGDPHPADCVRDCPGFSL